MADFDITVKLDSKRFNIAKNQIGALNKYLPAELRRATVATVVKTEKFVKMMAPKVTGDTARNVSGAVYGNTWGEVGTNQEAAAAIDAGAKPHVIRPKNAGRLAIPIKSGKGSYRSLSKKTKSGRSKRVQTVHYRDKPGASNKRHLDVDHVRVEMVNHPGKKPQPFLTPGAKYANRVSNTQGRMAVRRILKKGAKA